VVCPQTVELQVETTPEAVQTQHDSNVFKSATLENGMEVLVPHFVKPGDTVRIEVETGKYMERV
jgi:elongation factor P